MILLLPNVLTDVCQNDNYDRYYVIYYILICLWQMLLPRMCWLCYLVTDVIVTLVKVADVNHLTLEVIDCIVNRWKSHMMADVIAIYM